MPQRDAPPMPPKKLSGTEIMAVGVASPSAQGQEMTRKMSARRTHSDHSPVNRGGTTASTAAAMTTAGV